MANTYKNIVVTPNIGNSADPRIQFSGGNTTANTDINLYVYPLSNGTLSFEGSAGQLFSITNDLSNTLFSVNDLSGIPAIEIFANGLISVAPFGGNVVFGNTSELILSPGAGIFANGSLGTSGQILSSNGTSVYWATAGAASVNTAAQYTWTNSHTYASSPYLNNNIGLFFRTVNAAAAVSFRQQNDDNFVFYSTNSVYGERPVWSVYANSATSNLQIHVPFQLNTSLIANGSTGSAGQVLTSNGTTSYWSASFSTVEFIIDGGGSAITTGIKGDVRMPYNCTIEDVALLADQSGSIVIDLWKDTYANYPPTVADTITASAKPTLSSASKYQDTTLTGWSKTVSSGDIIRVNVDSVSTIQRITLSMRVRKT